MLTDEGYHGAQISIQSEGSRADRGGGHAGGHGSRHHHGGGRAGAAHSVFY